MADVVWRCPTRAGEVVVHQTCRADGDFHRERVEPARLEARRRQVVDAPWTMLDEVHGADVVAVDRPGAGDGAVGDVLVSDVDRAVLGVWTGDCAAVVAVAPGGRHGAAHAGWRGLVGGVLEELVGAVDPGGRGGVRALLGPVIGPCCYEFGRPQLEHVATALGTDPAAIRGRTTWGTVSLDVPAAVAVVLERHGVDVDVERAAACTRCDDRYFSHRGGDLGRHVTAVWRQGGVTR